MRWLLMGLVLAAAALVFVGSADAQEAEEWDAEAVEKAVEKAKEYLWSQWNKGHWKDYGKGNNTEFYKGGTTALCTYALLAAGESPQKLKMKKTLKWLAEVDMNSTYARAFRANVWGMLGRNTRYRRLLNKDVKWLIEAMDSAGTYTYTKGKRGSARKWTHNSYDHSNSQIAVLGVWAGAMNGIEIKPKYWKTVERHWKSDQHPDGGWGYRKGHRAGSYDSMTAAGLATMFICFDALYRKQFITCKVDTDYKPIVRGLAWMDKKFKTAGGSHAYYTLYGYERVGLAGGYKYFGKKDWYKMCAAYLLRKQGADGHWGGGRSSLVSTSFALLFLARGQHPVLFNKLQYPGSWNCRPRDLANLTRWISRTFEKQVNWQIIHLGVPVSEWHDAPILYVSGATPPKFSDKDIESLREFVYQGGVIFSETACNRAGFDQAMRKHYAKIFPRYELKRLAADHPVYNLHFKVSRRGLLGISNGVRLLAIHSPREVSRALQMNNVKTDKDVFGLAANVYFYVTDKGSLRKRGVSPWPTARTFTPEETLKVAVVKYSGNYNPEPMAWKRYSILMGNKYHVKVDVSEPTAVTDLNAADWPVAAMTGTTSFRFSEAERKALRKYIEGGGALIVDAAGGGKSFTASVEAEFAKVLPDARYGIIPANHAIYTKSGPAIKKVSYRRSLRTSVADPRKARLRGFSHNGRFAIIFSRDDLTAGLVGYPHWNLAGYTPDSSFMLMRNILLFASGKTQPGK